MADRGVEEEQVARLRLAARDGTTAPDVRLGGRGVREVHAGLRLRPRRQARAVEATSGRPCPRRTARRSSTSPPRSRSAPPLPFGGGRSRRRRRRRSPPPPVVAVLASLPGPRPPRRPPLRLLALEVVLVVAVQLLGRAPRCSPSIALDLRALGAHRGELGLLLVEGLGVPLGRPLGLLLGVLGLAWPGRRRSARARP